MSSKVKNPITHGAVDENAKHLEQIQLEKQVVVHCTYLPTTWNGTRIRIWPKSLFLIDKTSGFRSKLVWFENVTEYPIWKSLSLNIAISFTLVFESLPDNCTTFDLCEIIPEAGGFMVIGIDRNNMDVYDISL